MLVLKFATTSPAFDGINGGVAEVQAVLREVADRIDGTSEVKIEGQVYDSAGVWIGDWLWSPGEAE